MNNDGFALIPAGSFAMGADDGPHPEDGEGPAREVWLDAYKISRTAVSNREFALFVAATGHVTEAERVGASLVFKGQLPEPEAHPVADPSLPWWRLVKCANWRHPDGSREAEEDLPVVHVSRSDASAYCAWAGLRLPSEAEWERAAAWPPGIKPHIWSGHFPNAPDSPPTPAAVDHGTPNVLGLWHACGNVWEWTADRFTHLHSPRPMRNPKGPLNGKQFVVKGGSFLCCPSYCARFRPSSRRPEPARATASNLGFRVAMADR